MKTHKKQVKNARYHSPGLLKRDTLLRCLKISYLSRYTKNIMGYILIFMTFISFSVFADSDAIIPINLSGYIEKDRLSNDVVNQFYPEDRIKIQAGFNIVHWGGERGIKFYPLFQIYNLTEKPHEILIGMQLLDKNMSILVEISYKKLFKPAANDKPSYDTYLSLNAKTITKKIIRNSKYIKITYKGSNVDK